MCTQARKGPSFLPNIYKTFAINRKVYDNNRKFFDRHLSYAIPYMVKQYEKMGKFESLPFATKCVQSLYKLAGDMGYTISYGERFLNSKLGKQYRLNEVINSFEIVSLFTLEPISCTYDILSYNWKLYRIVGDWKDPLALGAYLYFSKLPIDSELRKNITDRNVKDVGDSDLKEYLLKNI